MNASYRRACFLVSSALVAGLIQAPAIAADRKAPRIIKAQMVDRDGDGFADRVVLTYSEKITHKADSDGKYPFSIPGYQIAKVAKAGKVRKLRVILVELVDPDPQATPEIVYKKTKKQPVRDLARNQARVQTFTGTLPFGSAVDHTLTVTKSGNGVGTVTSDPAGISCGATCSASFPGGSSVVLSAVADAGSTFEGWSGACSGTGDCTVSMDADKAVAATFTLAGGPQLTVTRSGSGSVTSSPPGIDCGTTCTASFPTGTPVTLTATPADGASFQGWSGACTGTSTCVVVMDADKAVSATFSGARLTVTKAGTGSGTVTSSPAGVDCGGDCVGDYAAGTPVTLTAVAAPGSTFTGWSGDCAGTGTCNLTMDVDRDVTATFSGGNTLTVNKAGSGGGAVTSSPTGIDCGTTCNASYSGGTAVTLTATPNGDSTFAGWSGACTGTSPTCNLTMDAAKTVTATFDLIPTTFSITVERDGNNSGTVTSVPAGINCGATCTANFAPNAMVTLTAVPVPGAVHSAWGGACLGTPAGTPCTLTMNGNKTVRATFNTAIFNVM